MITIAPPRTYVDPQIFEQEKKQIFQNTWQFVGFTSDLAQDKDWIATNIGGLSVVVQNFDGELKALHNVCSHRFAQIRQSERGNGVLQCPYHGWIYGADGCPSAIPSRPRFQDLDEDKIRTLALRRFQIETCGKFVFVKINEGGPDLRGYLGELFGCLEKVSDGIGTMVDFSDFGFAGNWKLVIENTLESYHVDFIHAATFGKRPSRFNIFLQGIHSTYQDPYHDPVYDDSGAKPKVTKIDGAFAKRKLHLQGYFHYHIFPNLNIATREGKGVAVHRAVPVSPTESRFQTHFFSCELENASKLETSMVNATNRNFAPTLHKILGEDLLAVELSQKGIAQSDQPGILSDEEIRVESFQKAYLEYLQPTTTPQGA